MFKDITLGQYYPSNSVLHRTDPRAKLLSLILFLVTVLISDSLFSYVLSFVSVIALIVLSKIPFKLILKSLKALIIIILITTSINLFFTKEGVQLVEWKFIEIYSGGVFRSIQLIVRFISILCGSLILISYTTLPLDLTEGIEKLLKPLTFFKIHVHDFAMMISIALRFIPTFVEETGKIISAQKARGAYFDSGNIFKKIKSFIPILIPLFVSAFRRASDLADAMECRCYNRGEGHTRMKELKASFTDYVFVFVFIILLVSVIILNKFDFSFT